MKRILMFVCILFVNACSAPLHVILHNSKSKSALIEYENSYQKSVSMSVAPNETKVVKNLLEMEFRIDKRRFLLDPRKGVVPVSFIDSSGVWPFFKRKVKASLSNDRCIYLVAIEEKIPTSEQPRGFPLCPSFVE